MTLRSKALISNDARAASIGVSLMAVIKVPAAPKSSMNQDRPVSALLKSQILHLQEAEFRLPAQYQTNIYIHSIQTEGDAGEYIRQVTQAIHDAHAARIRRTKFKTKPERTITKAAAPVTPPKTKAKTKKATAKKKSKKQADGGTGVRARARKRVRGQI
jgi:hypothetical protein